MRGVILGGECTCVNEVALVHGGNSYNIRIGKSVRTGKRLFTVFRGDGVRVLQGSGWMPAAEMLNLVVGVTEGKLPVGQISIARCANA